MSKLDQTHSKSDTRSYKISAVSKTPVLHVGSNSTPTCKHANKNDESTRSANSTQKLNTGSPLDALDVLYGWSSTKIHKRKTKEDLLQDSSIFNSSDSNRDK